MILKPSLKFKLLSVLFLAGVSVSHPPLANAQIEGSETTLLDTALDIQDLPPQPSALSPAEVDVDQIMVQEIGNDRAPTAPLDEPVVSQMPDVVSDSSLQPTAIRHSGTYFDASTIGTPDLTTSEAPREVDPKYEPGTSFVVVSKSAGPNTIPARMVAARRALNLGRYSAALELYEQLYKVQPKSHQVLMGLAVAQQKNGFTESAIATYEELLSHEPNNVDAMSNMLGLLKAQYPAVAFRRLHDLWEKNANNPFIASELALISASVEEWSEAIRYMGVATTLDPQNASHYYNMAVIYDRANDKSNAIKLYQQALQVDIASGVGSVINREQVYDRLAQLRNM